jgi:hypothetical protein
MNDKTSPETEQLVSELASEANRLLVEMLGRSVVSWSQVEKSIDALARMLMGEGGLNKGGATVMTANLDIREKCKIIVALAFQAGLSSKQVTGIAETVNVAQNELRNRRNRLYHDSWSLKNGLFQKRSSTGTRLHRPQAFKLELLVPDYEPIKASEISSFINDCLKISDELLDHCEVLLKRMEARLKRTQERVERLEALVPEHGEQSPRSKTFWSRLLRRGS